MVNIFNIKDQKNFEPIQLDQRKREDGQPVGLKNIGNTCYFNSFLQILYFCPAFVKEILKVALPEVIPRASDLVS